MVKFLPSRSYALFGILAVYQWGRTMWSEEKGELSLDLRNHFLSIPHPLYPYFTRSFPLCPAILNIPFQSTWFGWGLGQDLNAGDLLLHLSVLNLIHTRTMARRCRMWWLRIQKLFIITQPKLGRINRDDNNPGWEFTVRQPQFQTLCRRSRLHCHYASLCTMPMVFSWLFRKVVDVALRPWF